MAIATIGVVDYGMGNLRSVLNALDEIGVPGELVAAPQRLGDYSRLILPGVGAFADAMQTLSRSGLGQALAERVKVGTPLLGICLGMQLICERSEEDGDYVGLGFVAAAVRRFPEREGIKVPHMGWNAVAWRREHSLTAGVDSGTDVYFVHSFYVDCADRCDVLAETEHGIPFASAIARDNVMGLQFHPEKSQRPGLRLLANFAGMPC
jgi:imidazole glycerol-phosphate synthase subunit HisH